MISSLLSLFFDFPLSNKFSSVPEQKAIQTSARDWAVAIAASELTHASSLALVSNVYDFPVAAEAVLESTETRNETRTPGLLVSEATRARFAADEAIFVAAAAIVIFVVAVVAAAAITFEA